MTAAGASAAVLERALSSEDAEERRQATSRLRDLQRDEAIPLLLRSLGDADWRVRKEATVAARAFASERALLEALLAKLDERGEHAGFADVGLRNAIVEVLAAAGGAATRLVAERISKLDGDGRKLAVEILGKSGDPGALRPLEARLADTDDNVREAAVEAIASLGGLARDRVVPVLERCLDDRDRFVRLTALEGLNALGAPLKWERLEPLVADPTLRSAALTAAANADSPRAAPALARALASSNGGAFTQAMTALARMAEGPNAVRVVEALRAQGPELGQRLLSVAERHEPMSEPARGGGFEGFAPESNGDPRAIALVLAAAARAPGVAATAMEALGEQALAPAASRALCMLGPSALSEVLERLRAGIAAPVADPLAVQADAHAALVDVAAYIARSPEASAADRERVLEALRLAAQADRRVATGALFHLSRLGTPNDLALCAELALSRDVSVAHAAEGTLTALVQRYREEGRKLASSAAERSMLLPAVLALGALGEGEPVLSTPGGDLAFLEQAAATGDARTRRAAVAAVAELAGATWPQGATAPFDVLAFALADEERSVQLAAARALGRLCVRATEGLSSPPPPRSERDIASGRLRLHQPRASDVLELVGRSQDDDLLAATVRALADAAALSSRSLAPPPSPRIGATTTSEVEELIAALALLANSAPSPVAIAAVEALARAPAEERGRLDALIGALDHSDHGVVEATLLKLRVAATDGSRDGRAIREALTRCLRHSSPEVRTLASEGLGGSTAPGSGDGPGRAGRGRG